MSYFFFVLFSDGINKMIHCVIFHNTYCAAAETASCNTGTDHSRNLPCQVYQNVNLLTGNLIIVTKRNMSFARFLQMSLVMADL